MRFITDALQELRPGALWRIAGDHEYTDIVWLDETQTIPTQQEIESKAALLLAAHEANQYKQQRAAEYPSIGDQLDALFHAGVFPEAMAAQIQAIKDKYPKS